MKKNVPLPAFLLAAALLATAANGEAADFTVDGINYTILSEDEKTVSVAKDSKPTEKDVVIPSTVSNGSASYTVVEIETAAFDFESSITSVTIPDTVVKIGDRAFNACGMLASVVIGQSVVSIGDGCFRDCHNMATLTVGKSLTSIGDSPFFECGSLSEIIIDPENTALDFESGILYAGNMSKLVFCCRGVTTAAIPDSVTEICPNAFRTVTSLRQVTFGKSVTAIGRYAFYYCSDLGELDIPAPIDNIGEFAFGNCSGLAKISIGSTVTRIYSQVFAGCRELTEIHMYAMKPPVTSYQSPSNFDWEKVTLYVPEGSEDAYASVEPWKNTSEVKGGVDYTLADGAYTPVRVVDGRIEVDGTEPIAVYDMGGRQVYAGSERVITNLQPGAYIVRVAGRTVKVKI